ncbi:MAG: phage portal protein [Chloroflexi bacterium]|nr:phage portal protein [Chloroflexota bacterium]
MRERRLTFNYARVCLDKVTSYLMSGFQVRVEPADGSPQAADAARRAGAALRQVHEANNLDQLDLDTELDAAILGDGCYKVTWALRQAQGQAQGERGGGVRVSAPDVQGMFAWWRPDNVNEVWRVASRYQVQASDYGLQASDHPLYTPPGARSPKPEARSLKPEARPGRRGVVTVVEAWTEDSFQLWVDNELAEEKPNPYGFIPFVLFPNLRQPKQLWGVSDIPALMEPARELNRALSQLSLILELSGNPIAVLENVEEASDIAVQPGAVWELPEKARAYLLDLLQGGGIGLHVDYINLLYRALHDLAEAPRTSFGDNSRALSGVALEMELHPLLQKVNRKRLIRGAVYRRRAEMVLRLLEQKAGQDYRGCRVRVVWGPVLPQDRGRLVEEERALVAAGLHSRRLAMANLGVEDPEAELGRVGDEASRENSA